MEQLDFIAIRTKTTVDNLRALQTAGASLGSTADGMKSSLEGLSRFMRNTPGSGSFLASMGVATKDSKGKELDHAQVMKNLGASFRKMPQYMANQYAQMLGIDENTELAMRDPNFNHNYDVFRSKLGNLDATAKLANTAVNHGRMAGLGIENITAIGAKPVLDAFNKLDSATNGVSTEIGAAAVKLAELGTAALIAKKGFEWLAGKGAPAAAAAGGEAVAAAGGVGLITLGATGAGLMMYSPTLGTGQGKITDEQWANSPASAKESGNVAYGKIKQSPSSYLSKLLNSIRWTESRGNPNAVSPAGAMGAYQLMPATAKSLGVNPFNEAASRGAAGSMMSRLISKYKGNTDLALQAYNWGEGNIDSYLKTGRGVRGQAMPAETKNYPGQVAKGMTQNVTIHIAGSHDPLATGKAVHQALTRQYQLASRNTAGMTR